MSRWFRSATRAPAPVLVGAEEEQHLRNVEGALIYLLNDDIAEADRLLTLHNSSYHLLGRGLSRFIASVLASEKDMLKEAVAILVEAENKTWEDMKKAQVEPTAFRSEIYPPGTEYLLCYSVAQLTSAIAGVISGSVTEAVKGFMKLRKAFLTLDTMMAQETAYLKEKTASLKATGVTFTPPQTRDANSLRVPLPGVYDKQDGDLESPLEFVDALESPSESSNASPEFATISEKFAQQDLTDNVTNTPDSSRPTTPGAPNSTLGDEIDPALFATIFTHHTDIFIHSGIRLCFGLLLIVFSMIENPVFSKILYLIGFKGDRIRGAQLVWQATRFSNFNSAIAGIALLAYFNGLVGCCDILPTDPEADYDLSGFPQARMDSLLGEMRARYPESKLWKLEEARQNAHNKNLGGAIKILEENSNAKMKQIVVMTLFEMALSSMFYHDYTLCAETWLKCIDLSTWSPTLYAFMVGAAYLELYRSTRVSDPVAAKKWKEKATIYMKKGPPLAGRQKVMAKQLPFDTYVVQKVQKWEERAKSWNVDLVDAIGVSPLTEMCYSWAGVKKMGPKELQKSLDTLEWSRTSEPERLKTTLDETAVHALLKACVLRNMGRVEESKTLLQEEILCHDRHEFKGHLREDWSLPNAHYEMACIAWLEKDLPGYDTRAKLLECEEWLEKTRNWPESYVLETRMSFKVSTALITVRRHKNIMD
ncbi:hypothetical protein B7494_g7499 [Chlorociboria aeruginascens]|nr:hypothetical protein B7494_g7499 [Chlorociboria aeruginascens]